MRLEQLGAHIDFGPIWLVIDKGGPVVVVIGLISVVALAVALAKFIQFVGIGVGRGRAIPQAIGAWARGETDWALARLARRRNPAARAVACAIRHIEAGRAVGVAREDAARVAEDGLAGLRSRYRRASRSTGSRGGSNRKPCSPRQPWRGSSRRAMISVRLPGSRAPARGG